MYVGSAKLRTRRRFKRILRFVVASLYRFFFAKKMPFSALEWLYLGIFVFHHISHKKTIRTTIISHFILPKGAFHKLRIQDF